MPKPESERVPVDQRIQEEALRVAKSIQVPGQTKEQTKLIAKGIEKGIALYKQQQSAKARERDKARKRAGKPLSASQAQTLDEESGSGDETLASPAKAALLMAGALFALVGLVVGGCCADGGLGVLDVSISKGFVRLGDRKMSGWCLCMSGCNNQR